MIVVVTSLARSCYVFPANLLIDFLSVMLRCKFFTRCHIAMIQVNVYTSIILCADLNN